MNNGISLLGHTRKTTITTPTHIPLQDKIPPLKYHASATPHNPMLSYMIQQSQQVHLNPRKHQYIRTLLIPKSYASLEYTPPEVISIPIFRAL